MSRPGGPFDGPPGEPRSGGRRRRKRGPPLGGLWVGLWARAGRPGAAFGELQGSRQSLSDGPPGQPFGSLRVAADMVPGNPSIGNPTL